LTDRAYISVLYLLLLDRPADNAGLESFARQLRAGTMAREAVVFGIIDSAEFRTRHATIHEASAG
jgi:hypothetical protein